MRQGRLWASFVATLLLTAMAGCGGDEGDKPKPIAGTFVGKVPGTEAFVAVDAPPEGSGGPARNTTVYICDARRICAAFPARATGDGFEGESDDGDARARGRLTGGAVTGTLDFPGSDGARYRATRATAASGLYELTVAADGKLSGASAAGVALRGTSTIPEPGNGTLRLADGRRLRFRVTRASGDPLRLPPGQVRLIVLPEGEMRGVGKSRPARRERPTDVFIRSSE